MTAQFDRKPNRKKEVVLLQSGFRFSFCLVWDNPLSLFYAIPVAATATLILAFASSVKTQFSVERFGKRFAIRYNPINI